jgi:hypothetical protein
VARKIAEEICVKKPQDMTEDFRKGVKERSLSYFERDKIG